LKSAVFFLSAIGNTI